MDGNNLQTAASYVNNLLLARGLLRDGESIEFDRSKSQASILNLVHDLVLRRDREQEHAIEIGRELHAVNVVVVQQKQNIAKLEARCAETDRQNALVTAQERHAQASARTAEARHRQLREELGKLKTSVAQIRTQCATDIRRRDGEMQRLRKHLDVRRGREVGGTVVISPIPSSKGVRLAVEEEDPKVAEESLRAETNEFLARMGRSLIGENEGLRSLVKSTLSTLSDVLNLPMPESQATASKYGGMVQGSEVHSGSAQLAQNMDEVLQHLRGLLTNPSFVSVEEVEVREEEIQRLREGWESMAARWEEAVALMAGWKSRMINDGDTIKLEDLKAGLQLGANLPARDVASPEGGSRVEEDFPVNELQDLAEELHVPRKTLRERKTNTQPTASEQRSGEDVDAFLLNLASPIKENVGASKYTIGSS